MKLFAKLEDLINKLLINFGQLLLKMTPGFIKKAHHTMQTSFRSGTEKSKSALSKLLSTLFAKLLVLPNFIKVQLVSLSALALSIATKLSKVDGLKAVVGQLTLPFVYFKKRYSKLREKISALSPQTIVYGIILLALIFLASLVIVGNTKKIYQSSQEEAEKEIAKPENLRRDYYLQDDRQLLVQELTIPIYVGAGNAPKTLILDITIKMSNRYLKAYFYENDYLLKDRLNRSIEPIIPSLPLEEEGKQIIRDKIIEELNKLILERKIKGHVDDVYFHNIITG